MSPIVSEKHREERKALILDAAKEVFIKKGFNAATMQDIINHSGVSRGGVYTYFQNTEDIFLAVMKKRDLEDAMDLTSMYNECQSNWEVLMAIFEGIKDTIEFKKDLLVPAIYEYYFTVGFTTKNHLSSLEERYKKMKDSLSAIIRRGVEEGEFTAVIDCDDMAWSMISFFDGIYIGSFQLGPEKIKIGNQFEVFKSYLKLTLSVNKA